MFLNCTGIEYLINNDTFRCSRCLREAKSSSVPAGRRLLRRPARTRCRRGARCAGSRPAARGRGRGCRARVGQLGQVVPGRCWMVTDPFGESTSLMCEFSYPGGADRHALMVLRDLAWHGAVSSLSAVYLDDSDAGETAAIARWARRRAPTSGRFPRQRRPERCGPESMLSCGTARRHGRIGSPGFPEFMRAGRPGEAAARPGRAAGKSGPADQGGR